MDPEMIYTKFHKTVYSQIIKQLVEAMPEQEYSFYSIEKWLHHNMPDFTASLIDKMPLEYSNLLADLNNLIQKNHTDDRKTTLCIMAVSGLVTILINMALGRDEYKYSRDKKLKLEIINTIIFVINFASTLRSMSFCFGKSQNSQKCFNRLRAVHYTLNMLLGFFNTYFMNILLVSSKKEINKKDNLFTIFAIASILNFWEKIVFLIDGCAFSRFWNLLSGDNIEEQCYQNACDHLLELCELSDAINDFTESTSNPEALQHAFANHRSEMVGVTSPLMDEEGERSYRPPQLVVL